MRKLVIICLLSIFSASSFAQQHWAAPGATWYYSSPPIFFPPPAFVGYYKAEKTGDTLINSITCDIISLSDSGFDYWLNHWVNNPDYTHHYFYRSNDTIYHWYQNQFIIHGILNAVPGTTWEIPNGSACDSASYMQVDSAGTLIVGSDTLVREYLTSHFRNMASAHATFTDKIGYDITFFPYWECLMDFMMNIDSFRCYHDSSGLSYSNNIVPYCDFTLGTENIKAKDRELHLNYIYTYTGVRLTFDNPENLPFDLIIYDTFGRVTYSKKSMTGNSAEVVTSGWSKGIYIYNLQFHDSPASYNGKLVMIKTGTGER